MEPFDESKNLGIAPHPSGKPLKTRQGTVRGQVIRTTGNEVIHAVCIRPVSFNSYRIELLFDYQVPGNFGPSAVELRCTVARFSNKDEAFSSRLAKHGFDQRIL